MADWIPPPTSEMPILVDGEALEGATFNPVWLYWFLFLAQVLSEAGAGGGSIQHNLLGGLQGGQTDEYYHLTEAQHAAINTGGGDQIANRVFGG
jgi:hypothetical protein